MTSIARIVLLLICTAAYAQNNPPTLKETLQWMHNAFPDSQSLTAFRSGQTREFNFIDGKADAKQPSCIVTTVDHWVNDGKALTRNTIIDLSLIDPESIKSYTEDLVEKGQGELIMVATNDKKIIVEKMEGEKDSKLFRSDRIFISFIGLEYAQRFAKAFKNAVTLCGGKASTF